jgi:hypothetical protein
MAEPSADLLGEHDDDSLRAADIAEPVAVLIALHPTKQLRATGPQPGDGGVDVVDALQPTTRSTLSPSTGPSPSTLSPSSTKNLVAAARSSTTMPTFSKR